MKTIMIALSVVGLIQLGDIASAKPTIETQAKNSDTPTLDERGSGRYEKTGDGRCTSETDYSDPDCAAERYSYMPIPGSESDTPRRHDLLAQRSPHPCPEQAYCVNQAEEEGYVWDDAGWVYHDNHQPAPPERFDGRGHFGPQYNETHNEALRIERMAPPEQPAPQNTRSQYFQ